MIRYSVKEADVKKEGLVYCTIYLMIIEQQQAFTKHQLHASRFTHTLASPHNNPTGVLYNVVQWAGCLAPGYRVSLCGD